MKTVKPKNNKIPVIEIKISQLAKRPEKNSRSIIRGKIVIIAPIMIKIDGIAGDIIFNSFIVVASKTHPIKVIAKPIVTTEEII